MAIAIPPTEMCPWSEGSYFKDKLIQMISDIDGILGEFVEEGQTVLDLGCWTSMSPTSLPKLVGVDGRVIIVDPCRGRLDKALALMQMDGLKSRIQLHHAGTGALGVREPVDFAVAFWMIKEAKDPQALLKQVRQALGPKGHLLLIEPQMADGEWDVQSILELAAAEGMEVCSRPRAALCQTVLLRCK